MTNAVPPHLVFSSKCSSTLSYQKRQKEAENHKWGPKAKLAFPTSVFNTLTTKPNAFYFQQSMLKSSKIWCISLLYSYVGLQTFWMPLVTTAAAASDLLRLYNGGGLLKTINTGCDNWKRLLFNVGKLLNG